VSDKYEYLKKQWNNFKTDINSVLKNNNDKCFSDFVTKINSDSGLTLYHYAVKSDKEGCSYLCNFIERVSAEIYGSAKPGNMYNYGISLIGEKKEENKFFINSNLLADKCNTIFKKNNSYEK